jgi:hypothetical protein
MGNKKTKSKKGVLRVARALLNRIEDDSQGVLIEGPDEVREFLEQNEQVALALDNTPRLALKAIWDLDSTAVQNVRFITLCHQSVHVTDLPELEDVNVTFEYDLVGDEDEAASDLAAGIIPILRNGSWTFTFSFFEEYECDLA